MGLCIFIVSLVVTWNCHNSTRSITTKHKIAQKDWNFFSVYRIYCLYALDFDTTLFFVDLCSIKITLERTLFDILFNFCLVFNPWHKFFYDFSIRCNNKKCYSKNSFYACCENWKLSTTCNVDIKFNAFALSNPIALNFFCWFWPINIVKTCQKFVCIFWNVNDPLLHFFANNRISSTLTFSVYNFIIGKNSPKFLAPIYGCFNLFCQIVLIELFENPLRPFVVGWVACCKRFVPIKRKTKRL